MKNVLLVEDDIWLSDLYVDALNGAANVLRAQSAEEVLDFIDQHKIDLIVLDMFLPGHNGVELLHELASYEDSVHIPVIVLSAVHQREFTLPKSRWHHYGVVEYLYKPEIKPRELVERVERHLREFATVNK